DPAARMHLRADLPHEDVAGHDALAAEHLYPAVLPRGIASIARRPLALLVCHLLSACPDAVRCARVRSERRPAIRLTGDAGDLQLRVGLAVPADAVPTLFLGAEVPQLAVLAVRDDLSLDLRAAHRGRADLDSIAFADRQHLERQLRAHWLLQLLDLEQVAFLDAVLLSARADHCVHRTTPWPSPALWNQPGRQGNPAAWRGKERAIYPALPRSVKESAAQAFS